MNKTVKKISFTALFAAMVFGLTMLHIPIGAGGYIHVGDAMIYLSGCWGLGRSWLLPSALRFLILPVGLPPMPFPLPSSNSLLQFPLLHYIIRAINC